MTEIKKTVNKAEEKICWCFTESKKEPELAGLAVLESELYRAWTVGRRMVSVFGKVQRTTVSEFLRNPKVTEALLSAGEWKAVSLGGGLRSRPAAAFSDQFFIR